MTRLLILGAVGIGLVFFFIFMGQRLSAPNMALLYSNLDPADAGEIVGRLDSMGVPYELQGGGGQVMVPSDQVLRVRMTLAGEGLPAGGSVGYEIFDRSEGFGTTNLVQNINMLRALEGELSRTISSLGPVAGARVHLVVPRRELFSRDQATASASIAVKLRGSSSLGRQQVAAIQNLVAAAVPGLDPTRIAIIDDEGNLLARGTGVEEDGAGMAGAAGADEFRAAYENQLRRKIEGLLEQTIGPGGVRAQVSAEMDFDRFTTNDEIYDPDGQVVRSQQTVEERSESSEGESDINVSADNNLPGADPASGLSSNANSQERTEETINYEISRTVRTHIREAGTIKRLSVAVMVDGRYGEDADGVRSYEPRPEEELSQLTQLVRTAVGFEEERGDSVEVVNLQFAQLEVPGELEADGFSLGNVDVMKVLEIVVLGFVSVLVILLVLRPMMSRLMAAPDPSAQTAGGDAPALAGPAGGDVPALPPGNQSSVQAQAPEPEIEEEEDDTLIDLGQVEGRVRQSHVRKIGEIVDKHPDEALNIVRSWLYS
jgi:flagellar M-ring protein FliF